MAIALFILEAAALSAFLASGPAGFVLLAPAGAAAMYLLARGTGRLFYGRADERAKKLDSRVILSLSPVCLLLLKHLPAAVCLREIRGFLVPLATAGTIILQGFMIAERRKPANRGGGFGRRPWPKLFLAAFAAYAFLASGLVFPQNPLTGDEPHYLLITKSLIDDGDIDLFNNTVQEDHRRFYPGELESHAKPGRGGARTLYSRHLPGISVLLAPFYLLAERAENLRLFVFIVRLPICLLTALLGAAFYLFALDLTESRRAAAAAWLVFSFAAPVLFFSGLIYSEVPAALITLLVFRSLFLRRDARPAALFLSGAGLGLLPWLSVKYIVFAVVLFALAASPLLKKARAKRRELALLAMIPLLSGLFFLVFLRSTYGSINPIAVYSGADAPPAISTTLPWRAANVSEFASAGLSLFFEQKAGIFVYAPVYLLAGAGFLLLWRKKRGVAAKLLALLGAYWTLCAASYFLGGFCPPGRPLLPVMWILAGFASMAIAAPAGRVASLVRGALAGFSLLVAAFAVTAPQLLYQANLSPRRANVDFDSRFLAAAGTLFFDPRKWAPALNASAELNAWPLAAWILLSTLITILLFRSGTRPFGETPAFTPAPRAAIVSTASLLLLALAFFHVHLDPRTAQKTSAGEWFFQDDNHFGLERDGFWTKGSREAVVVLKAPVRLSAITVELSSAAPGEAEVRADRFRRTARHDPQRTPQSELVFFDPRGFPWRGVHLYVISVRERHPFVPYHADRRVRDNRNLGIFVKIHASPAKSKPDP
jgi:hypothetical protein